MRYLPPVVTSLKAIKKAKDAEVKRRKVLFSDDKKTQMVQGYYDKCLGTEIDQY